MFDQPLGLDLAPGWDTGLSNNMNPFNTDSFGNMPALGLDMMGTDTNTMAPAKEKRKKTAWVDVSKLIEGKAVSPSIALNQLG